MNKMATTSSFFVSMSCVICGYHVYKEVWSTSIGEHFVCFNEEENVLSRKAVAVICTEGFVVGHLPLEISSLCFHFIKHRGEINGKTTGRRQHTKAALGGKEIPCHLTLSGKKNLLKKAKELILGQTTTVLPVGIMLITVVTVFHLTMYVNTYLTHLVCVTVFITSAFFLLLIGVFFLIIGVFASYSLCILSHH